MRGLSIRLAKGFFSCNEKYVAPASFFRNCDIFATVRYEAQNCALMSANDEKQPLGFASRLAKKGSVLPLAALHQDVRDRAGVDICAPIVHGRFVRSAVIHSPRSESPLSAQLCRSTKHTKFRNGKSGIISISESASALASSGNSCKWLSLGPSERLMLHG